MAIPAAAWFLLLTCLAEVPESPAACAAWDDYRATRPAALAPYERALAQFSARKDHP